MSQYSMKVITNSIKTQVHENAAQDRTLLFAVTSEICSFESDFFFFYLEKG